MTSPNERRAAILKAATRLFEHYGHGKTTIAEVAREARIGVGTVYLEFESKEAIVEELSLSTHAGVLDAMRAASEVSDDHAARLAAVLHARTRCFLELRKRGQHACELVHCKTEGVRAVHERFREQEHALLTSLVTQGRDAGAFAACAPASIAALLQRAFASLSPPWIFGSDDDAMRASNELCQLLLHGLLTIKRPLALLGASPASAAASAPSSPPGRRAPARKPARRRR
ncbi:MAG: TetR/AcrR family transcriptional regulator [Labilithrix sp.]|nr:TetR/AcrR family transcriptional regulator [Labilithrix sp.]MCW5834695.1 TetR/AcrR family transcriptional regulator [Labilithrix sp.]